MSGKGRVGDSLYKQPREAWLLKEKRNEAKVWMGKNKGPWMRPANNDMREVDGSYPDERRK